MLSRLQVIQPVELRPNIRCQFICSIFTRMIFRRLGLSLMTLERAKLELLLYLYVELHYVHKDRCVAILLLIQYFDLDFWLLQFSRWQLYYRVKIRQFISLLESCVVCIIRIILELRLKWHHIDVEVQNIFEVERTALDTVLPCIYPSTYG